jgi:ABC-type multidrug transport system ATPase subunit
MLITLQNISKKFNNQWIFRSVDMQLFDGNAYAITGSNGSGKSTLLSVLSGYLSPTLGKILYEHKGKPINVEDIFKHISIAAPYLELIEEYTLSELIDFHFSFTSFISGENKESLISFINLQQARDKQIRFFSSGMKQRVKLGLALFSDKPILLLDEPTVNLDNEGIHWYQKSVQMYALGKLLVICSNQPHEYMFVDNIFKMTDFQ